MKKTTAQKSEQGRKPYEKPSLRCVNLAAEEVLAKGCKMASAGNNYGNPVGCVAPSPCVNIGS